MHLLGSIVLACQRHTLDFHFWCLQAVKLLDGKVIYHRESFHHVVKGTHRNNVPTFLIMRNGLKKNVFPFSSQPIFFHNFINRISRSFKNGNFDLLSKSFFSRFHWSKSSSILQMNWLKNCDTSTAYRISKKNQRITTEESRKLFTRCRHYPHTVFIDNERLLIGKCDKTQALCIKVIECLLIFFPWSLCSPVRKESCFNHTKSLK